MHARSLWLIELSLVSALLCACRPELMAASGLDGGDEAEQPGNPDEAELDGGSLHPVVDTPWCRALAVFQRHCQSCHGEERQAGAPMSLTRYDDLIKPAVTEPTQKVYELVSARVHNGDDPMPPQGKLKEDELAVLDAWLTSGHAPGADPGCTGLDPDDSAQAPAEEEPWPADCDVFYTIFAHDPEDPSKPFRIPAGKEVQVALAVDQPPWGGEPVQALAFRSRNDNTKVLHHWNLFEGEAGKENGALLWGWAPGNQGSTVIPDDVGFFLPQGPVNFEMHYYNVAGTQDEFDRSGVEICATHTFRKHTASITKDFNAFPLLPPNQRTDFTDICRVVTTTNEDIHVLGVIPHMHKLGVHAFLSVEHDYQERVLLDNSYSFFDQRVHPMNDELIKDGDVVTTRCTWNNTTNNYVDYGPSSDQEMCANFAIYWPMDGFLCLGI